MTNNDDDTVSKETLEAFKDAARDVLPEGELATKETIDSALAEHEEKMAEKYGLSTEEKELDSEEAKENIMELADATGADPDIIANAVRDALEGSDEETIEAEEEEMPPEDDEVTEVPDDDIEDPDDDDEMEVEVEDEEEKSVVEQLEEKGAPDDLVDAVKQYVDDDAAEKGEDEDDEDSMPDYEEDDEEEKEESVSKSDPAAQAIEDAFVSVEGVGPVTGDDSMEKSYEFEKDEDEENESGLAALTQLEKSGAIN